MAMKILFMIDTMLIGGAQKALLSYCEYLIENGYTVTLVSLKKTNKYALPKGLIFIEILDETESLTSNIFKLLDILVTESKKVNLIIGFMDYMANYLAYLVANISDKRVILSSRSLLKESIKQHGQLQDINYTLIQSIYNKVPIIVQSQYIRSELLDFFQLKNERIYIVPNSIIIQDTISSNENIFIKNKVFIVVARLIKLKRIDIIIEAFKKLITLNTNLKLLIIGYGEEESFLKSLVKMHALEKDIHFIKTQEALPYIKSSYALIQASKYEGFSNVILEAMSQKTLVIASDIESNKEIINHTMTGLLFAQEKVDSLFDSMVFALNNEDEIKKITNVAFQSLDRFSLQKSCKTFEKIIHETMRS